MDDVVNIGDVFCTKFICERGSRLLWERYGASGTAHGLVGCEERVLGILIGVMLGRVVEGGIGLLSWEREGAISVMAMQVAVVGRGAH